ncbi:MAG: SUMF1/EgtB/PvdO family nonheme iron enzyme [Cytophagales bacterium]|nr:SUMF1/EgtB/PvdO family nonheme iron enzyme [Cytophagales bacterium]
MYSFLEGYRVVLIVFILLLSSCAGGGLGTRTQDDKGELVGVPGREGWRMHLPLGMVFVRPGTFHMGQADEDISYSQISFNRQVTVGGFYMDDTEITNNEYRQFVNLAILAEEEGDEAGFEIPENYTLQDFYPDTTVWINDFTHHLGDPLLIYYWNHPAFDNYPVVGISWVAARVFANWRTYHLNNYRANKGLFPMPNYRLPTEAEWEYASRGGRELAKYPWGSPYISNKLGCFLANFKGGRGNYVSDGYAYTAPVGKFFSNDFGLYDMAGNVAEWCEDAYSPISNMITWDMNPLYSDESEPRKIVRGGSWKDISYFLETGTRNYEYKDSSRSSIGFRCVMTYLGRSSGNEF